MRGAQQPSAAHLTCRRWLRETSDGVSIHQSPCVSQGEGGACGGPSAPLSPARPRQDDSLGADVRPRAVFRKQPSASFSLPASRGRWSRKTRGHQAAVCAPRGRVPRCREARKGWSLSVPRLGKYILKVKPGDLRPCILAEKLLCPQRLTTVDAPSRPPHRDSPARPTCSGNVYKQTR